jgi:hypothetical protein
MLRCTELSWVKQPWLVHWYKKYGTGNLPTSLDDWLGYHNGGCFGRNINRLSCLPRASRAYQHHRHLIKLAWLAHTACPVVNVSSVSGCIKNTGSKSRHIHQPGQPALFWLVICAFCSRLLSLKQISLQTNRSLGIYFLRYLWLSVYLCIVSECFDA